MAFILGNGYTLLARQSACSAGADPGFSVGRGAGPPKGSQHTIFSKFPPPPKKFHEIEKHLPDLQMCWIGHITLADPRRARDERPSSV